MAPLLLIAQGLAIGFRAQVWNIGAEGQLILGPSRPRVWPSTLMARPSALLLPGMIVTGMLAGMGWAADAAFLKTKFNANEILVTFMLTSVALQLPLLPRDRSYARPNGVQLPQSISFAPNANVPDFDPGHTGECRTVNGIGGHGGRLCLRPLQFCRLIKCLWAVWHQAPQPMQAFRPRRLSGWRCSSQAERPDWLALGRYQPLGHAAAQLVTGLWLRGHYRPRFWVACTRLASYLPRPLWRLSTWGGDFALLSVGVPDAVTGILQGMLLIFYLAASLLLTRRIRWTPKAVT